MALSDWIGSLGVGLLLVAFFLNLIGWMKPDTSSYQGLNALGAGLACYSAWLIGSMPFLVLEGAWALAASAVLARKLGAGS